MLPACVLLLLLWSGVQSNELPDIEDMLSIPMMKEAIIELGQRLVDEKLLSEDVLEGLGDTDSAKGPNCPLCVAVISEIVAVIESGGDIEDIKVALIPMCEVICDDNGWRPDILCEPILDLYLPHMIYTLTATEYTPREACTTHRICDPVAVDHETKLDYFAPRPHKPSEPKRRDLENAIKIVQITDVHVDQDYSPESPTECMLPVCCREKWNGTGSAGAYGDYECNTPPRTVELFADLMAQAEPDFVIYNGNAAPLILWESTLETQITASQYMANMFEERFPGVDVYPTLGNHDSFASNQFYATREDTITYGEAYYEMWQDLAGLEEENRESILECGNYQKLIRPGLRLLSYNSNYGNRDNYYGILNEFDDGWTAAKQFMQDTFDLARANGEKILLLGHHPIGTHRFFLYYEEFVDDIVSQNGDIIALHAVGHDRFNTFKLSIDFASGDPTALWMVTSSLTGRDTNPTTRIFYLDPDTFEILEYDTYYLDLAGIPGSEDQSAIVQLYRATEEYGIPDISPESIYQLTENFLTDEELFDKYRANRDARTGDLEPCDMECRLEHVCAIRTTAYWQYIQCMNQAKEL